MPTWRGSVEVWLAGGGHHVGPVSVVALTAAQAAATASQEAIDQARCGQAHAGAVDAVTVTLSREGA